MAELDDVLAALRKRADDLRAQGPGRVEVDQINHINEVRMLRECREILTPAEQLDVRQAVIEMENHLHGIEVATAPPKPSLGQRLKQLFGGGAAAAATREAREHADWNQMATAAGGPAPLPPPRTLLDAAEAWVIAELTRGRVDVDFDVLTAPWLNARVVAE